VKAESSTETARTPPGETGATLALAFLVLLFVALRLRFLDIPLERDEGDYAYIAQQLLQGVAPYTDAYEMRLPGIFAAYALILAVFGETHVGIHAGLLVVNAATIALLYRLGARLFEPLAGIAAAAVYACYSLSPALLGFTANTEHFVLLPVLAGALLLLRAFDSERTTTLFWSGLLFGVGLVMKQHAVFFAAFGAALLLARRLPHGAGGSVRALAVFGAGVVLPTALCVALLAVFGDLSKFWFWTFVYPGAYVTRNSWSIGWGNLRGTFPGALRSTLVAWCLAGGGLIALFAVERFRAARGFILGLLGASLAAFSIGLTFRHHAYLFMGPALALLAGALAAAARSGLARRVRPALARSACIALVLLPVVHFFYIENAFLFRLDVATAARRIFNVNPFAESLPIARYIREHSEPGDRIAVLGSEPQIYFYAQRRSATAHILVYPFMEQHSFARKMQDEAIAQIEAARPRFIVFVNVYTSWNPNAESDRYILEWYARYVEAHYRRVGFVEIERAGARYYWEEQAAAATPTTNNWIAVYERADTS
jgi:hypothetical protein